MEDLERNNFDNRWKDAFEGSEVSPSEQVWTNVEQKLDRKAMKKRVIFYQRLAAACVLFALVAASFGVYHWSKNNERLANGVQIKNNLSGESKRDSAQQKKDSEQTALNKNNEKKSSAISSIKEKPDRKQIVEKLNQKNKNDLKPLIGDANKNSSLNEKKNSSLDKVLTSKTEQAQPRERLTQSTVVVDKSLSATHQEKSISSNRFEQSLNNNDVDKKSSLSQKEIFSSNENQSFASQALQEKENIDSKIFTADLSIPELGLLPIDSVKSELVYVENSRKLPAILNIDQKEKIDYEKIWVAVTASEGSYAANNRASYASSASYYTTSASNISRGSTYTAGVLGGVRFTNRWVLQAGLQYINQSSGYTSNIYASSLGVVAANASQYYTVSAVGGASPYGITSTNEFISVPLQAGYLLLNGKFGVQINSGVASNFFVRNTLSDPSGQRKSYSQGPGENSPYRSVNFAGLLSSELSYRFAKSYRLSFVPGLGYSFNSIMKNQTMNNPLSWDVGFRFRYIFR